MKTIKDFKQFNESYINPSTPETVGTIEGDVVKKEYYR